MNNNQSQDPDDNNSQPSKTYRPVSPDLSGFSSPPPLRLNRLPSVPYQTESDFPRGYSFSPRGSYDASPYFSPQVAQPPSYFGSQTQQSSSYPLSQNSQIYYAEPQTFSQLQPDMARLRNRPPVNYNDDAYATNEFDDRIASQQQIPPQPQSTMAAPPPPPALAPPHPQSFHYQQQMAPIQPYPQHQFQLQPQPQPQPPFQQLPQVQQPPLPQIDVRTKFPVARIKRIMQADEDIGKVAQATPTAVAKSLELFMIALVSKGAADAKAQNSKRVTATHLKNALLADPQYDFLKDICENAPDESAKKSRAKSEAKSEESDDEDIAAAATGRKKRGTGGRKKKAGGDESD